MTIGTQRDELNHSNVDKLIQRRGKCNCSELLQNKNKQTFILEVHLLRSNQKNAYKALSVYAGASIQEQLNHLQMTLLSGHDEGGVFVFTL